MVECLNCKSNNPIDSKFCIICGNALIKKCSSCNLDLPAVAHSQIKFDNMCFYFLSK